MDTLQVPTRTIDVELRIGHGEPFRGRVFASETTGTQPSVQLLLDLLNDEREFVPFDADEPAHGRIALGKRHIVSVQPTTVENEEPEQLGDPGDTDDPCSILLSDGSELIGRLRVPTPWSASRVLDKLNQAARFVPVVTEDGISIVHGSHIVRVLS